MVECSENTIQSTFNFIQNKKQRPSLSRKKYKKINKVEKNWKIDNHKSINKQNN